MELVLIDTAQIQSYIFNSNRLREHIGASHLVDAATTALVYEALKDTVRAGHNVRAVAASGLDLDEAKTIDLQGIEAEVIYAGGGNVAILFTDADLALQFRRHLTSSVITRIPGIALITAQEMIVNDQPWRAYKCLLGKLSRKKAMRKGAGMLRGISVTRWDRSTGEPVVGMSPEGGPIAASTREKIRVTWSNSSTWYMGARDRLEQYVDPPKGFTYPTEFDHMGRSEGRHSYVAIVHADGDGMGRRLRDYVEEHRSASTREFVNALRTFSAKTSQAAAAALKDMFQPLKRELQAFADAPRDTLDRLKKENPLLHDIFDNLSYEAGENGEQGKWYIPFRPVVYGGDDITFVCDGRLGLTLATKFCEAFKEHAAAIPKPEAGDHPPITASAGVCIVKTHYPFAQAYHLAEELAQSAKQLGRELGGAAPAGCIDWHFARSGLAGELELIRKREYDLTQNKTLLQRPVSLGPSPEGAPYRNWQVVLDTIKAFRNPADGWVGRRSKMKTVFETLRQGEEAMKTLTRSYRQHDPLYLPDLHLDAGNYRDTGFAPAPTGDGAPSDKQRSLYFDALELVGWHVILD